MNRNREEALFALALERPTEKRAAFLNAMCEGEPARGCLWNFSATPQHLHPAVAGLNRRAPTTPP
jgi:hypothetical protein